MKNDNIKISVIVPCYNVSKYIGRCLSSITGQTHKDIEIICINDGSTDDTLDIINSCNDERLTVIDKKNTGYGSSMNIGLKLAKGKYIGIVESDDFIEADMYEKLLDVAEENKLDITRCRYYHYKASDDTNDPVDCAYIPKNKILNRKLNIYPFFQPPSIWAALYSREFIINNNINFLETPGASYQDTSFAYKLYKYNSRFMLIDDCLLHYRIDNEGSSVNSKNKAFCICDEFDEIWKNTDKASKEECAIVNKMQFTAYKWNYKRLNGKLRVEFLKKWSEEIRKQLAEGCVNFKYLNLKDKMKMIQIAYIPQLITFK